MFQAQKQNNGTKNLKPKRVGKLYGVSVWAVLVVVLAVLFVFSFVLGRYSISPQNVLKILISHVLPVWRVDSGVLNTIVMDIRLPRILAAMVGGGQFSVVRSCVSGAFP